MQLYSVQSSLGIAIQAEVTATMARPAAADGCSTVTGVSGKIALIDRGTCTFVVKVQNAITAGAAYVSCSIIVRDCGFAG